MCGGLLGNLAFAFLAGTSGAFASSTHKPPTERAIQIIDAIESSTPSLLDQDNT